MWNSSPPNLTRKERLTFEIFCELIKKRKNYRLMQEEYT